MKNAKTTKTSKTTKGQKLPPKAKKEKTMSKNTAKKADKATAPKTMTYPQAKALTNALFHAKYTKADISAKIDKLPEEVRGKSMNAERKAQWLAEHGQEEATYGQCKMLAFGYLNAKLSYDDANALLAKLDAKNGYVRPTKAEKTVKEANEVAAKQEPKQEEPKVEQLDLFAELNEQTNTANA